MILGPTDYRSELRRLWVEHVFWTRLFLVSAKSDGPATEARLLRNQDDIGTLFGARFGTANGQAVTKLLREHIAIAKELVLAAVAKVNDGCMAHPERCPHLVPINEHWHRNADEIAKALSKINRRWNEGDLRAMLYEHLQLTLDEVLLHLKGKHDQEIVVFDRIEQQALKMADGFAAGWAQ